MDVETYSKTISDFIAGGYITSAITLGNDLGLFEELKRLDKPVTSQQLADACKLKERYVREWLGCMVSTRIVLLDESDNYFIPDALKPGLNATDFAFIYPVMGTLTENVKKCWRADGPDGFGYEDMPRCLVDLTEGKTPDPDKVIGQLLMSITRPKESLITILDLGCGGGNITRALSRHFPDAQIYGVDYNDTAIDRAVTVAKQQGIRNETFIQANVTSLPRDWTHKFDWVILYDVLHDLPDPVNSMKEVYRVLKDDGVASIVDPGIHSNHKDNIGDSNVAGVGYAISSLICLPCSLSTKGAVGNGIGWGKEDKEAFLSNSGWIVIDKRDVESAFALNFTCVKANA
ncbi:S-adenosylmethionine-dependent methyltransferase Rv2258c-like [Argopecten irradians]|uniref:S-adenosylmethionine-dependent methyltransferase Rv2258c-like n=1 Tax=Argopecten irradians TaxID=31199 RepID=UPI00371B8A94